MVSERLPDGATLNAICPYFTMFPLQFPLELLQKCGRIGDTVLDPFCGRGTTNFAARMLGFDSMGVDASPVAAAITAAKLLAADPTAIVDLASDILRNEKLDTLPSGDFWSLAYHRDVLVDLCKLRQSLCRDSSSPERAALRGILLGALHGPKQVNVDSYFSNQCPRTFAPKPNYAMRFWKERGLIAKRVDTLRLIARRAERYYRHPLPSRGKVLLADSREAHWVGQLRDFKAQWIITSPPYYGMRTYIPDQWLRSWFVGGKDVVDYSNEHQVVHRSPDAFANDLRSVWLNVQSVSKASAQLVILFGGISDRAQDPLAILRHSLEQTAWEITGIAAAGDADSGKRQANSFLRRKSKPVTEHIVWAVNRAALAAGREQATDRRAA